MPSRADIIVGPFDGALAFEAGATNYVVQTSSGALYLFYIDNAIDVYYRKSTDSGITWGLPVQVFGGSATQLAVWYDRWSGINADLIHIAYTESVTDDVLYKNLDASSDTLGSQTTIFAGASTAGSTNALSITRARGGNLVCVFDIDGGTEDGAAKSTDVGATWGAAIADPTEGAADMWILAPGWNADAQDVMLYFWDISADEISVKRYDDSGNTWTETSISAGMVESAQSNGFPHFAVAIDLTNSLNVLIAWNGVDTANQDLKCWTVTDAAITAKTDVVTNATDDCGLAAIAINSFTGAWIAFYAGKADGSETWSTLLNIYYRVSTDSGTTWGSETKLTNTLQRRRVVFTSPWSYGFPFVSNSVGAGNPSNCIEISVPVRGPAAYAQIGF